MAGPRILLVGGNPAMAAMLIDYFHHDDRYEHDDRSEIESVAYCDDALALLECRRFDLVLVLSLHVPWKTRPSSYSATWRIDFANAILLLKHLRARHGSPPVILISGSPLAEAKEEALANGAFAFLPKPADLAELDRFVVMALESRKGAR
jgi:CheY-like chemotaxis protein